MVRANSYADRARHFRTQAIAARAAGDLTGARRLDGLARRATAAHQTHAVVGLDDIVAIAARLEHQWGRVLTIGESSAIKAAYQATCARNGTYATLLDELTRRDICCDVMTQVWAA